MFPHECQIVNSCVELQLYAAHQQPALMVAKEKLECGQMEKEALFNWIGFVIYISLSVQILKNEINYLPL